MPKVVLNTRPEHQSKNLSLLLEQAGFKVCELPLLDIKPIGFQLPNLTNVNCLIFLSANAVTHFFSSVALKDAKKIILNKALSIIAIGPATQKKLSEYGVTNAELPQNFSSNGIISMPYFQTQDKKNIVIISGREPNTELFNTLKENGHLVISTICYERVCKSHDPDTIFEKLKAAQIDIIVTTSFASLVCLMSLFQNPEHLSWLRKKILITTSEKGRSEAITRQFTSVFLATDATDASITNLIKTLAT